MYGSAFVYFGALIAAFGLMHAIKPVARLGIRSRRRGLAVAASGAILSAAGLSAPAFERRTMRDGVHLDAFAPDWQFNEIHMRRIAAPPERVYEAIKRVRADEIWLFHTLTRIRRGGRPLPAGILNAGSERPVLDIALDGGFVSLADDPPREIVIGTVVVAPRGRRPALTRESYRAPLPPGVALGTMNFLVEPDGSSGSIVSTETRVFASDASARRRFAVYWRLIYPGSALIRRMWLRAIEKRVIAAAPDS